MPRRRRDRLIAIGAGLAVLAVCGCTPEVGDAGCELERELILPGTTPLALMRDVRVDRIGPDLILIGADDTAVRWMTVGANNVAGAEHSYPLPAGTIAAHYALAGVSAPGDRVIVGLLTQAAAGAELHFVAAPTDGSIASLPGPAIVTFGAGVTPAVTMGSTKSAMVAGVGWLAPDTSFPTYALVDGQGGIVDSAINQVETDPDAGYSCLSFTAGVGEATLSYLRDPTAALALPTWVIADFGPGMSLATLKLGVGQLGAAMIGCALTVPTEVTGGYAMVWQDFSGSWLSIYYGQPSNQVLSYPFASSTDFGGPNLQPPIRGLARFASDYGVVMARPRSVELWRLDREGRRRDGALVFPSLAGELGEVSSVVGNGVLTSTYADFTGGSAGRRIIVDAACH
jgi:hypothetical protein